MASLLTETDREPIAAELHRAAVAAYGEARAEAIAAEVRGLAGALARVAARRLPIRDWPV